MPPNPAPAATALVREPPTPCVTEMEAGAGPSPWALLAATAGYAGLTAAGLLIGLPVVGWEGALSHVAAGFAPLAGAMALTSFSLLVAQQSQGLRLDAASVLRAQAQGYRHGGVLAAALIPAVLYFGTTNSPGMRFLFGGLLPLGVMAAVVLGALLRLRPALLRAAAAQGRVGVGVKLGADLLLLGWGFLCFAVTTLLYTRM